MVAQVVAQAAGGLGDIVGMRGEVVVRQAVGVGVPLAENAVLGLGGFGNVASSGRVLTQVILIALDTGGEIRGILAGI